MIELSKDFKHGHKLWSVWCAVGIILISVMEQASAMGMSIAPLWKEIMPEKAYPIVIASLSTLGVVARFIKQTCISVKEIHAEPESNQAAS